MDLPRGHPRGTRDPALSVALFVAIAVFYVVDSALFGNQAADRAARDDGPGVGDAAGREGG